MLNMSKGDTIGASCLHIEWKLNVDVLLYICLRERVGLDNVNSVNKHIRRPIHDI